MKKLIFMAAMLMVSVANADFCGKADDRAPSDDLASARLTDGKSDVGCSMTLISNSCAITANLCTDKTVAEFNIPATIGGQPSFAAIEDVYEVEKVIGSENGGVGANWAVIKLRPNTVTGKLPGEVQGFHKVETKKSPVGVTVKLYTYSMADNSRWDVRNGYIPPNREAELINRSQSIAKGELIKSGVFLLPGIVEHTADTYSGSLGAGIINTQTNEVIGVTTHGGCAAEYHGAPGRKTNAGTSATGNKKFKKAIQACLNLK